MPEPEIAPMNLAEDGAREPAFAETPDPTHGISR